MKTVRLTGWVLWRESPAAVPEFQFGTLVTEEGRVRFEVADPKVVSEQPGSAGTGRHAGFADVPPWLTLPDPTSTYVVPGFVDLHSHIAIGVDGIPDVAGMEAAAWEEIRAGVLAIREPGSPKAVPAEALPFGRPLIVSAGRHIALEKRYIRGLAAEIAPGGEEQVSEDLVAEVRRQAAVGDGWVKLVGDWIDRSNGEQSDLDPLWTEDQMRAAVEAAHSAGAKVAVHAFSSGTIPGLLAAGVDSIEHGSGMSREQMEQAAQKNIPVVPTALQVLKFPEFSRAATRYPVYAQTMQGMYDGRREWFGMLLESGVQILPGSDAGGYQRHGALVEELQTWVRWGMAPAQALDAATWQARDFLGLESLSPGAPSDAVVFGGNPGEDAQVWGNPVAVLAAGHLVEPN